MARRSRPSTPPRRPKRTASSQVPAKNSPNRDRRHVDKRRRDYNVEIQQQGAQSPGHKGALVLRASACVSTPAPFPTQSPLPGAMERISLGLLEEARKVSLEELAKQQRTLVNVKPSGECVFGAVAAAIGGETGAQLKQHLLDSIGPVYGAFTPHLHS